MTEGTCRSVYLITEPAVAVPHCELWRDHDPPHRGGGVIWTDGVELPFARRPGGYTAATSTRAFAVVSAYGTVQRQRFTWDLEVRDLTAAPGIRHRIGAPALHVGRYQRRNDAYAVALTYVALTDGYAAGSRAPGTARWRAAHQLTGVPRLDVPPHLAPGDPGPNPWRAVG